MTKEKSKITEKSIVAEVLKLKDASEILEKHNFPCLHCPMAAYEIGTLKIGEVAKAYNLDLKGMLKELNKNIKTRK